MIGRLGKGVAARSPGRPLASPAGARESLRDRLRAWFGKKAAPGPSIHIDGRRRFMSLALLVYLLAVSAGAVIYNVSVLRQESDLRRQVESGSVRVASIQRLTGQLDAERQTGAELQARLDQLYRELPGAVELPLVMARLAQLQNWSGGSVSGNEYSEPRWTGDLGQLQTHAALRGSLQEVVAYIRAVKALLPAAALERLTIRLDGEPGIVSADLLFSAAVMRERPAAAPVWDLEAALMRAEGAVRTAEVPGYPFTPGMRLWREARAAGMSLPELRLAGVARTANEAVAVIVYHGSSALVRAGDRVGPVEVLSVDAGGVLAAVGGRVVRLEMTNERTLGTRGGDGT